jgi:hypothetical protein
MVRCSVAVLSLFLAGCAVTPPPPTPAEAALQSQCEGGNADACMAIIQAAEQKRATAVAASSALMGYAATMQQPAYPRATTCSALGTMVTCR